MLAQKVSAAGAPADGEERGLKRQRILKMMRSDEQQVDAEEAENVILEELIKKIKKAASAQLLYSEDPQCASTVHFWSNQVLAALKAPATPGASAAGAGAPGESHQKTQLIKKHFAGFLVRLMYGAGATVTSSTSPQCWRAWNLSAAWRQLPSVR